MPSNLRTEPILQQPAAGPGREGGRAHTWRTSEIP